MRFDIAGHKCEAFLCRQYWYKGQLLDEANVLFLKTDSNLWHRICFDCGVLFWKEEKEASSMPSQGPYEYPLVNLASKYKLGDRLIEKVWQSLTPMHGELGLSCEGGTQVILRNTNDRSTLEIRSS
jgi:hypothetical protein